MHRVVLSNGPDGAYKVSKMWNIPSYCVLRVLGEYVLYHGCQSCESAFTTNEPSIHDSHRNNATWFIRSTWRNSFGDIICSIVYRDAHIILFLVTGISNHSQWHN